MGCVFYVLVSLLIAAEGAPADDAPFLEIRRSAGAVEPGRGGEARGWENLRLELSIANHLPVTVIDLELEVTLLESQGDTKGSSPIAGWKFLHSLRELIPPSEEVSLHVEHPLPARRRSPRASEIVYRADILGYRLSPPSLDLALKLLESSAPGDQRAAMHSYELENLDAAARSEVARLLLDPPRTPDARDALRLLLAIRAAGLLADPDLVEPLLKLKEHPDAAALDAALSELAERLRSGSQADEPRLLVLPPLLAQGPLSGALKEALIRIGDRGVPELVLVEETHKNAKLRAEAASLLHALGRSTARSQLAIEDRATRIRLIEAFGASGSPEVLGALAELAGAPLAPERQAAIGALVRVGPKAVPALIAALGTPDARARESLLGVLERIGPGARKDVARAGARYGVTLSPDDPFPVVLRQLGDRLSEQARQRWTSEIEHGLALGRTGSFEESIRVLDTAYVIAPEIYLSFAEPIARTYLRRAQTLFARGNYDAVAETLRVGQNIYRLPEAEQLLWEADLALARGFLELEDPSRAEEILERADPGLSHAEARSLRAELLGARAELALSRSEHGAARALLERARAFEPQNPKLAAIDRRLLLVENYAIVIVLGLALPAGLFVVVLLVRRRMEAQRMKRLALALDQS